MCSETQTMAAGRLRRAPRSIRCLYSRALAGSQLRPVEEVDVMDGDQERRPGEHQRAQVAEMDEVEVPGHPGESSLLVPEAGGGAGAAENAKAPAQPVARRRHLDDDAPVRLHGLRQVRGEPSGHRPDAADRKSLVGGEQHADAARCLHHLVETPH